LGKINSKDPQIEQVIDKLLKKLLKIEIMVENLISFSNEIDFNIIREENK